MLCMKGREKMPLVNYCKKCKTEVPLGDSCPYCAGKLTQSGEQISFGLKRRVVKEWFAWNGCLRIVLPVLGLVCGIILAAEASASGTAGIIALFEQGFWEMMLGMLVLSLLAIWLLLLMQGVESVHTVLDRQGVHVRTYIAQGNDLGLYARLMNRQAADKLAQEDGRAPLDGLMLVRSVNLPWDEIRRVKLWREGGVMLFFRPSLWQAAAVSCPVAEWEEAEAFMRKKMKRFRKVKIAAGEKTEKKKKR